MSEVEFFCILLIQVVYLCIYLFIVIVKTVNDCKPKTDFTAHSFA